MNLQDNPKLTAYALGELDPTESARLDKLLKNSSDARSEVDDIRRVAAILGRELGSQPAIDAGNQAVKTNTHQTLRLAVRIRRWGAFAAAACLLLAVGAWIYVPSVIRKQFANLKTNIDAGGAPITTAASRKPAAPLPQTIIAVPPPSQVTPQFDQWATIRANNPTPKQVAADPGGPASAVENLSVTYDLDSAAPNFQEIANELKTASLNQYPAKRPDAFLLGGGSPVSPASASMTPSRNVQDGRQACVYMDVEKDSSLSRDKLSYAHMYQHDLNGNACGVPAQSAAEGLSTEAYDAIQDNPFLKVDGRNALSIFSIDVDTASYANVRRMLLARQRPPKGAVRIEEFINYFTYDYPPPTDGRPFSVNVEIAQCPWQPAHRLARIGLRGKVFEEKERPSCNLVFLIDVSGSMQPPNKLALLKQGLALMVPKLTEKDRVAMVVYAGTSGLVLESTPGNNHAAILSALERLEAGGSTNGAGGIAQAYQVAMQHKIDGVNRVILATDGDFNVGVTSQSELVDLIEKSAKSGVFLSVLGVGMGNYKDSTLEKLADKGNGNYAYIDTLAEAKKVLVDQIGGTLVTIAKDVKIQVEFNPAIVQAYRLIGYENRVLAAEDFNNDKKDAGEIGAGHTVTALYELVPVGATIITPAVDGLKYQPQTQTVAAAVPSTSGETMTVKLRYKQPDGDTSALIEQPVVDTGLAFSSASADTRFAAAVAAFGMLLRDSPHKGNATYALVSDLAGGATLNDPSGYRAEFQSLVQKAQALP